MFKKELYSLWGILFIFCAGFGFVPAPDGFARGMLVTLSLAFFVPPMILMVQSKNKGDKLTVSLIRNLSVLSLGSTVLVLILNFLFLGLPEVVDILYVMLVIVSAPMICSQYWVVSLFFWACLLMMGLTKAKKK